MKKTLLIMSLLMVLGLLVAGCSKGTIVEEPPIGEDSTGSETPETPDEYIDEQIVSENETVEIGEMI